MKLDGFSQKRHRNKSSAHRNTTSIDPTLHAFKHPNTWFIMPRRLTCILLLCTALMLAACDEASSTRESTTPNPPDVEALVQQIRPYSIKTTPEILRSLGRALHDSHLSPDHRVLARYTLATAALELWLEARLQIVLSKDPTLDKVARELLRKQALSWRSHIDASLANARLFAPPDTASSDPIAFRLRALFRPLLKHPEYSETTRNALLLLEAADTRAVARSRLAKLFLEHPETPLAPQAHALLAEDALSALYDLQHHPPHERVLRLAAATPQICRDGIPALADAHTPAQALDALVRHCGFACTTPIAPGAEITYAIALDPSAHITCPSAQALSLDPKTQGAYLSFHNHLATLALNEVQRLTLTLQKATAQNNPELLPLVHALEAQLESTLLPGSLPFFAPEGPSSLTLSTLHYPRMALPATSVVVVILDGALHLAAWPTWRVEAGRIAPPLDALYGFPGRPITSLETLPADRAGVRILLEQSIAELRAAPWPTDPTVHPPTDEAPVVALPVIIDREASVGQLQRAASFLSEVGIDAIDLVAWPDPDAVLIRYPEPVAIRMSLRRPQDWVPRLHLADNDTYLLDMRVGVGERRTSVPIIRVERYLPDIYETVLRYAKEHPGLEGLALNPEPSMSMSLFVQTLDALRFERDGDTRASTEQLLDAPPRERQSGEPVPLIGAFYLL